MQRHIMMSGLLVVLVTTSASVGTTATDYEQQIQKWRQEREASLKSDEGWLTVAGLFWLREGSNTFGSDPANDIVVPAEAPRAGGVFEFHGGQTTVRLRPDVVATLNGEAVTSARLKSDASGKPDVLALGSLRMFVIKRGTRHAIRLRDLKSTLRRDFTGLHWYPVRPSHRIVARWVAYERPKMISIPSVLGESSDAPSPGYASFTIEGRELRLEPYLETPEAKDLFFVFKDLTSARETYQAGRFLHADLPSNGAVVLDFNMAYNPPCVFTPFATCPLPPPQNVLPARIEAGELRYGEH